MAIDKTSVGPSDSLTGGSPAAVRAGDLVFLSGVSAPDVDADPLGFRSQEQTGAIFDQMRATLDEAGSSMGKVVKLQTFHRDLDELPSHLSARTRSFTPPLPPSTAVEASLAHPGADVTINGVAVVEDAVSEAIEVESVPRPLGPYSQAVHAPPFVFLAGVLASDFRTGVAPEARIGEGLPYFGSRIKSQTSYVLSVIQRILEEAGCSLESVVKAQVILTDMSDFWGFEEVWQRFFPSDPPARTVIQGGLVNPGHIVEIDVVALGPDSGLTKRVINVDTLPSSPLAESHVVVAGDWLFFGSQLATDYDTGVTPAARIDPNFPRYDTPARRQGSHVIERVEMLLSAGGSSFDRLVNLWAFVEGHNEEFVGVRQVLSRSFGADRPAVTLTGTGAHYVPGCVVSMDGLALIDG